MRGTSRKVVVFSMAERTTVTAEKTEPKTKWAEVSARRAAIHRKIRDVTRKLSMLRLDFREVKRNIRRTE